VHRYLSVFPYIGLMANTLQHCIYELLCFLILFFIVFIGCGQAFTMTFGPYMAQYSNIGTSMMSLFRIILVRRLVIVSV
jgi:hypothetical protein